MEAKERLHLNRFAVFLGKISSSQTHTGLINYGTEVVKIMYI